MLHICQGQLKFLRKKVFEPIPGPTNFRVPLGNDGHVSFGWMPWLPSIENMGLMDKVFHEFLGNI